MMYIIYFNNNLIYMIFFIIRHEVWEIRLPKNRYQPSKKNFFYFFFLGMKHMVSIKTVMLDIS